MKHYLYIPLFILAVASCKKNNSDINPNDIGQIEEPDPNKLDDPSGTDAGKFTTIDGIKYDNQRVSMPHETDIVFENLYFINRLDSMLVVDSTHVLSWSILVPEAEGVTADWFIDAEIPFSSSEKKFWLQNEKYWRYVFTAKIDEIPVSGKGKLGIKIKNTVTGEVVDREYNIDVRTTTVLTDYNWVSFGMSKEEVKERELSMS